MTSVQNLRLRLNGSNFMRLFVVLAIFLAGCNVLKKSTKPQEKKPESLPETIEKIKIYDPVSGQWIEKSVLDFEVDTVQWTEILGDPVTNGDLVLHPARVAKDQINVALFLPLNTSKIAAESGTMMPARVDKFIQFYAGCLLGMRKLEEEGIRTHLKVFDTEENNEKMINILQDRFSSEADLFIGPYWRASIEQTVPIAKNLRTPIITPWNTFTQIGNQNPYLIFPNPSFETIVEFSMREINRRHPGGTIYVVTKSGDEYLMDYYRNLVGASQQLINFKVTDKSMDMEKTFVDSLISADDDNVFIIPYFRDQDLKFVYSFLRKVRALSGAYKCTVYGLPQWKSLLDVDPELFNSAQIFLITNGFLDKKHPDYLKFKQDILSEFGNLPNEDAYQGYDLIVYFGRLLASQGKDFYQVLSEKSSSEGLFYQFHFLPSFKDQEHMQVPGDIQYFINKNLMLTKVKNYELEIQH